VGESGKEEESLSAYDWSDDVKGAKAVRVSNLFEKFQYDLKRKIGGRNSDVAFGTGWFSVSLVVGCRIANQIFYMTISDHSIVSAIWMRLTLSWFIELLFAFRCVSLN
jgi:hypothetical protein